MSLFDKVTDQIAAIANDSGIQSAAGNAAIAKAGGLVRSALPNVSSMMALGMFVFGMRTIPYQQLQRARQWRHPSNSRVGRRPAHQFTGPGDETITLTGTLYPELTGGPAALTMLAAMADTGKAWPLIQGDGTFYGHYFVETLDDASSVFFADGAARKIEFTIKLTRADDDRIDMLGTLTKEIKALL